MTISRWIAIASICAIVVYAFGSGLFVTSSSDWYLSLAKPSWQPPNWVFGVIWPYNFVVLGIASLKVTSSNNQLTSIAWLAFLSSSIFAALLWSYLFYQPHNLGLAASALGIAAALTLPLTVIAFATTIRLGVALLPYQVWIVLAASLSTAINRLN